MSDAARDLYSFLRSKDFIPSDEEGASEKEASDPDSSGDENPPNASLRAVDSFDDEEADAADHAPDATEATDATLNFDDDGVGEKLRQSTPKQLNGADFGIVKVDDDGVVEFYNDYESNLSGVDPDNAHGRNFFTQLAPCSNNRIFLGRFKKGVRKGELDERFNYTFTYKMRPTLVDVRLYRDDAGNNWILVRKR